MYCLPKKPNHRPFLSVMKMVFESNLTMRHIFSALVMLCAMQLSAQQFIQEFSTIRNDAGAAVQQVENREFLMANYRYGAGFTPGGLNLTKMSDLARLRWSRDYDFDFPVSVADLSYWSDKNAYLVSTMSAVDSTRDKIVARFGLDGNLVWARRLGGNSPVQWENTGRTKVLPVSDTTLVMAGGPGRFASDTAANDLMLAKLDADGNLIWSRSYCFSCLGNYETLLGDLLYTADGGFLLSGGLYYFTLSGLQQDALLVKTDSEGQIQWVNSYAADFGSTLEPRLVAWNLAEPQPGKYVFTGTYNDLANTEEDGLLVSVNDTGAVQRAARWNLAGGDFQISTFDLVVRDTNTVVMAGSTNENTTPDMAREYNFLAAVHTDTLQTVWAKNYFQEVAVGLLTPYHSLVKSTDNGYGYLISIDTVFVNSNPVLIKTNSDGETGCEQDLTITWDTLPLFRTNWMISAVDLTDIDTIELKDEMQFSDITPTTEGLELTGGGGVSCEPVMEVLDATVQEAESYAWSTGESTPMITATKAGQYTVLVKSDALCFSLPDTTSINVLPPPMGTVSVDPDSLCEENQVLLFANGTPVFNYLWSNGEITPAIVVSTPGTYTVTMTNTCGSISVSVDVPRVGCICDLVFPNAFTPDGDSNNDLFQPAFPCPKLTEFKMYVYNRWGENVFETNSQTAGWDGKNNGEPAPSDVYAWYATFKTPEGQIVTKKGDVTLLR